MSVDISVSITEDVVDIIATPTVNIVNVTNSASIDPGLYDLSEFTNTSPNPFVRASGLSSYVPTSRTITINGLTQDLSINRSWTIPATTWGTITGTLSAQTDLQSALDAKVPTSRTLTINGVTQDLSADRTFTISTGITIGSTAITSGTVGRVLFQGTGNVVQQSSSLFWDATNNRLGIGTSSPLTGLHYNVENGYSIGMFSSYSTTAILESLLYLFRSRGTSSAPSAILSGDTIGSLRFAGQYGSSVNEFTTGAKIEGVATQNFSSSVNSARMSFYTTADGSNAIRENMRLFSSGNLLLQNGGTFTDAGFRLDVNGTARVTSIMTTDLVSSSPTQQILVKNSGGTQAGRICPDGSVLRIKSSGAHDTINIFSTGNLGINQTTDAGFRLDVNGTARVQGALTSTNSITADFTAGFLLSGGVAALKRDTTGYIKTLLDCGYDGGLRIRPYSAGFTSYVDVRSDTSAALTVTSTNQGFLPPRLTTTQKNAIASPAAGLMVYDTTLNVISYYNGSMWI